MLKTHMAACLLASALVAAPALAQTATTPPTDRPTATGSGSTTSGSPAMQPGGTAGSTGMSSGTAGSAGTSSGTTPGGAGMGSSSPSSGSAMGAGSAGSAGSGMASTAGSAATMKPLAAPQPGQIMGSDLRGTRVYGANNESIGDISDLLLDRQGQVVAAIVGVGGFLGIGQKDVAVPFQALEIVPQGAASGSGTQQRARHHWDSRDGRHGHGHDQPGPRRVAQHDPRRSRIRSVLPLRRAAEQRRQQHRSSPVTIVLRNVIPGLSEARHPEPTTG